MSTTNVPVTATSTHDPLCTVVTPGHECRRRDGQPLTGTNGDCWVASRMASIDPELTLYGTSEGRAERDHYLEVLDTQRCEHGRTTVGDPRLHCPDCDALEAETEASETPMERRMRLNAEQRADEAAELDFNDYSEVKA